jgi:predicted transcriptional regulator
LLSKYRNRVEIIGDILNIVRDGARKTQIMYKGNLSYKLLRNYLREVIGAGLVCVGDRANIYQLTEKGKMFLRDFESYSRSRTEAEQQLTNMNSLKTKLEGMCVQKGSHRNLNSGDEEENQAT